MENKTRETTYMKKNTSSIICLIIALLIGAAGMFLAVKYGNFGGTTNTIINKSEKEVTVTDKGIADAVDKLYDATVIVKLGSDENPTGWGSGFVYSTDDKSAYIVTNYHVTSTNKKVYIEYSDGSKTEGEVLGGDEKIDISVIKVSKDSILAVAEIGESSQTRLGDTVFAVGTPISMSYKFTVTRGILSGKDRLVQMNNSSNSSIFGTQNSDSWYISLLQIDASINSGNSGGPLANSNGQVIGITNSKLSSSYSSSASIENIGFAIPIEDAKVYIDAFISGEDVKRPKLGVQMLDLSERWSLYQEGITLNTELKNGVVIVKVQEKSPADKAGLKRGDIVTAIDGVEVSDSLSLKYALYKHSVGETITITYEREGKMQTSKIELTVASED